MSSIKKRKGAASFYIVAFSTLILVIIAAAFATAMINELMRTSNNDLSQSAYDSAMAGVEDAKLAFLNYKRCLENGTSSGLVPDGNGKVTCDEIFYWVEHPDCYQVAHILGRIPDKAVVSEEIRRDGILISDEVKTSGNKKTNNLNQAYTCVMINTVLDDYRSTLTTTNNSRVVKVELANKNADSVKGVVLKWYPRTEQTSEEMNFANVIKAPSFVSGGKELNWRVGFQPLSDKKVATPPALSLEMIQTSTPFNIDDFTRVIRDCSTGTGCKTNRASFVLVPTDSEEKANVSEYDYNDSGSGVYADSSYQWWGSYVKQEGKEHSKENFFPSRWAVDSNAAGSGRGGLNPAYLVYCDKDTKEEYMCKAFFDLPGVIGGNGRRNNDTFLFVVTLPYGQPDTEFALEFLCSDDPNSTCGNPRKIVIDGVETEEVSNIVQPEGIQVEIDSTGRANDLFRRVKTRLETAKSNYVYPLYGIQLLGEKPSEELLDKNMVVTSEYNFK